MTGLLELELDMGEVGWTHRLEARVQGQGRHTAKWTAQERHHCGRETEALCKEVGQKSDCRRVEGQEGVGGQSWRVSRGAVEHGGFLIGPNGPHLW